MHIITENSVYKLGIANEKDYDGADRQWITLTKVEVIKHSPRVEMNKAYKGRYISLGIGERCELHVTSEPKLTSIVLHTSNVLRIEP